MNHDFCRQSFYIARLHFLDVSHPSLMSNVILVARTELAFISWL